MKMLARMAILPLAISAVSAQALEELSESELSTMTGQAGVTIELDTAITLDSLTYTDTDTGGQVVIGGVVLGGGAVAGGAGDARLDNLKIKIDVNSEGDLIIAHEAIDYVGMLDGSNSTDFGLHAGYLGLSGTNGTSVLASDINISGVIGPGETVVFNDGSNGLVAGQGYAEVTDGSLRIDAMGMGISNLRIFQDDNPFASATYTDKDGNDVAKWTDYNTDVMVDTNGDGTFDTSAAQYATDNGNNQWVFGAGTLGTTTSSDGSVTNALFLRSDSAVIDMSMNVGIGDSSLSNIGYIEMQNINTTGTELVIYGH